MGTVTLDLYLVVLCLSLLHFGQLQQCNQTYDNQIDVSLNKRNCNMTSQYYFPRERKNGCYVVLNGQCTTGDYGDDQCVMTEDSNRDRAPTWTVDLEQEYTIQKIIVTSRREWYGIGRIPLTTVWVDNVMVYKYPATVPTDIITIISRSTPGSRLPAKGQIVKLSRTENKFPMDREKIVLTFCKLEVWVCKPGHYDENCSECGPTCTNQFCDEINNTCSGPCKTTTCQNGGTCTSDYSVNFTCTCPPGVTGDQCQTDNRPCTVNRNLCENNGICINTDNGTSYTCACTAGYTGRNCQTDINECSSQPCVNVTCHDMINGYFCNCSAGYTGTTCNQDIDECLSTPCGNGYCNNTKGSYFCSCYPGYGGTSCTNAMDAPNSQMTNIVPAVAGGVGGVVLVSAVVVITVVVWSWKRRVIKSERSEKSTTVTDKHAANSRPSTTTRQRSEEVVYEISQDPETEGYLHVYDHAQFNAEDGQHTYCSLQTPLTDNFKPSVARKH